MCFGQLGAQIIRDTVSKGDGQLEIMIPGNRRNVIFCAIKLENYVEVTDVLQEESVMFLNQIVSIIHQCASKWNGWANKSEGDKYILTWKIPQIDEMDNEKNEQLLEERTEMADKSLITAVKIVAEMRRAVHINQFYKRPELILKFGTSGRPNLTFALHMGWTIEGAIGSESKIDACYLSPHLQASYKMLELTEFYDSQILVAESVYNIMSLKARNTLRKIDVITMKENKEPLGIYTYDISFGGQEAIILPEEHEIGDLIKLAEYETINIESFKNKGVDYMFTLDSDLVMLQQHISEFNPIFRLAFKSYIQGDWQTAGENIERCLELWDTDGPTKAL
jgi:class 3 adenylate cyclase